eukprot:7764761-Pyramimonas_sp.AAC.1
MSNLWASQGHPLGRPLQGQVPFAMPVDGPFEGRGYTAASHWQVIVMPCSAFGRPGAGHGLAVARPWEGHGMSMSTTWESHVCTM